MKRSLRLLWLILVHASFMPGVASAQTVTYTENFTGVSTNNNWYFFGGACLTAGSSNATSSPGQLPSCRSLAGTYYSGQTLIGGNTGSLPDLPSAGGALRLTNASLTEHGAILSDFSFPLSTQGLHVKFTTESYAGNSAGGDGADGISFFLQDASQAPGIGAVGGSLAYTCTHNSYNIATSADGLVGAYIGLGIDEYGNFLNQYDNTASGWGPQGNRIGLRGAGNVAWSWLLKNYSNLYQANWTTTQQILSVYYTCQNGYPTDFNNNALSSTPILDYAAITNGYSVLSGVQIANEKASYRGTVTPVTNASYGVPITYDLKVTAGGLLSLTYSYNGGAFQSVLANQDITAGNGALPAAVRFGFGASTGGGSNIHEIMCFQAAPPDTAGSSGGINLKQTAQVQIGTQVYFAKYDPTTWAGSLTSQYLATDTNGNVIINPTVNWDASCVLTGGSCASTGVSGMTAQGITSATRTMLTWNGSKGIPFEWTNLTAAEQAALDTGDTAQTANRLLYLRGQRSNEQASNGSGIYRARASVLGDIVDSGATWVGPPSAPYPAVWKDNLYPSRTPPENSGPTYQAFTAAEQTRPNLVFAGANDGFMHGFRSGSFTTAGAYSSTANDGAELLAYMPAYVLGTINTGVPSADYSDPHYGHQFNVDAPPGTGELYYEGAWHTWLVGGLGAGGAAIYALDITDAGNFSETNAGTVVIGEWSSTVTKVTANGTTTVTPATTLGCAAVSTKTTTTAAACGNNLGSTYGVPQIRRFHNGDWGVVFGNGFGSFTGDAGVFVMLVDAAAGTRKFYYLSTGTSGTGNGIAFTTPADLDGDHVVDFIYAGDLAGNVWRFDVTNSDPTQWAVLANPIFQTGSGQPITTKLVVASVTSSPTTRVLVEFGTGQFNQFTNTAAASYLASQQAVYGVWDWDLAAWNALSTVQYAVLPSGTATAPSMPAAPAAAISGTASLQAQTFTSASGITDYRVVSAVPICWADTSACSGTPQYGWYMALATGYGNSNDVNMPTAAASSTQPSSLVYEQVVYSPILVDGSLLVNTTIPATNSLSSCVSTPTGGWTMAFNPATGGAFTKSYFNSTTTGTSADTSGVALSGTGSPSVVSYGTGNFLVTQTVPGTGTIVPISPPGGTIGGRLTWIQRR
jgi:type IV pilus assembly protein PilY1